MNDAIVESLTKYVKALQAYAQCPDAMAGYFGRTMRPIVQTQSESSATLLSATRWPVRGLPGVRTEVREPTAARMPGRRSLEAVVTEGIPYSASGPGPTMIETPCAVERRDLHIAFTDVRSTLFADGELALRLADGVAYKTYEPHELPARMLQSRASEFAMNEVSALSELFRRQIDQFDVGASDATDLQAWDSVLRGIIETLSELQSRRHHAYDAFAFLNGPLCDFDGERSLLRDESSNADLVLVSQAKDQELSRMVEGYGYAARLPDGLDGCNTLLRVPVSVPVLGTVAQFESRYPVAADLVSRALDVLRVVVGGDIGVSALTIESRQFGAPTIRPNYHNRFNHSFGAYVPHRAAFATVTTRAVTEDELRDVAALLARHAVETDVVGFGVAINRFRDAWERHWPETPERLLDIAIALEALFLNDGEEKELKHRLALRVARFLEPAGDKRLDTFRAVRQLYDLRSKVAHGATIQTGNAGQNAKLQTTMVEAPEILRRAIRRMIEGNGPSGLRGEALIGFWRDLELRGD